MSNYITENDNWAPKTTPDGTESVIIDEGSGVYKFASLANVLKNVPVGTVSLPGMAFSGDLDTGLYRVSANSLGIATGGVAAVTIDSSSNVSIPNGNLIVGETSGFFSLGAATELTIASGVVTATKSIHSIDTESDGATDDLDTISGGVENAVLMIYAVNAARDVVAKDGTGNLRLNGDFTMDSDTDMLTLRKYGSNWVEVCRSSNA